ncbi:MAG: ubiquinone biosynthesis protein Coq4 [Saprospiraceae bacterium]|jgi:ubiquinone biosynthesis protein Coq4
MKKVLNFRKKLIMNIVAFTKPYYVRWFKKNTQAWNQSVDSLKRFPKKSLGKTLGLFLEKNKFTLLPKLEDHDVLHVLLGYKTTITGEIKMQFFLLGNRKRSVYALFTAIIGTVLVPEKFRSFSKEFNKGRRCAPISKWDFEHLLSEPIVLLQQQVFFKKLDNQPFII